jgi:chromosome condensin MukBEF complex kleisin-like MukF subunit
MIIIVDIGDEIKKIIDEQKIADAIYKEEQNKITEEIASLVYGDIKNTLRKLEYLRNKQKGIILDNDLRDKLDQVFRCYAKIILSIYSGFYSANISNIKGWCICGLLDENSLVFKKLNGNDL